MEGARVVVVGRGAKGVQSQRMDPMEWREAEDEAQVNSSGHCGGT